MSDIENMAEIPADTKWIMASKKRTIVIFWIVVFCLMSYKIYQHDFELPILITAGVVLVLSFLFYKLFMLKLLLRMNGWSILINEDGSLTLNWGLSPRIIKPVETNGAIILDAGKYWVFSGTKTKVYKSAFPNLDSKLNNA